MAKSLFFKSAFAAAMLVLAAGISAAPVAPIAPDTPDRQCAMIRAKLSAVSQVPCEQISFDLSGARSRRGVPILSKLIVPSPTGGDDLPKPRRILLIGGIHGDELTSTAIVLNWTRLMGEGDARDFVWDLVPLANPDGFFAAKPTRLNSGGVDLNRNFNTPEWKTEAPAYWVKRTHSDPRRYPGPTPLSEPETQYLNEEINRFRPDVIISVHAPYSLLDFDGPTVAPTNFGMLSLTPVGVYPGSLGNYSGLQLKVPVITIELPHALIMPPEREVARIWTDMLSWININIPRQMVAQAEKHVPPTPVN